MAYFPGDITNCKHSCENIKSYIIFHTCKKLFIFGIFLQFYMIMLCLVSLSDPLRILASFTADSALISLGSHDLVPYCFQLQDH
jgi:hypothetical protein